MTNARVVVSCRSGEVNRQHGTVFAQTKPENCL